MLDAEPVARDEARRRGDAEVLRLRFEAALKLYTRQDDRARLYELGFRFGRYRVVSQLHQPDADWLRQRALPQVPIGGDAVRGFSVDEALIREIAARLGEPVDALCAATVRRMLAGGSRQIAKLYVLARLSGDEALIAPLQRAFDARAAHPRAALDEEVRRRFGVALVQAGDADDYNPLSAHLWSDGERIFKEHLRLPIDPSRLDGYSEELELLSSIDHPRLPRLVDVVRIHHHELLVMRRAPGRAVEGRLPRGEALRVAAQLAETLAWLHARAILYLDVKPRNLVFDGRELTLVDFGMARRGPRVTSLLSTLEYVPPECGRTFTATAASDAFQLGLTLHQLVTGHHPFSDGEGVEVALANAWEAPRLRVGGELGELLAAILDKDPARRPTAADAHAVLR